MQGQLSPHVDRRLADLSATQHGIVHRDQLRELGLGEGAIEFRVVTRRLHRIHRGVFGVGHMPRDPLGRWMAAVLACGPGAVLSHRSAALLHAMQVPQGSAIDVTVPDRDARRHTGIAVHRPRTLVPADEVTVVDGIPVTTAARTLLDLGDVLNRRQLERACDDAERNRVVDWAAVLELIDRHPRKAGAPGGSGGCCTSTASATTAPGASSRSRSSRCARSSACPRPSRTSRCSGKRSTSAGVSSA